MMVYQLHLKEMPEELADLIKAAINGEETFIITDDNQRIQLVPVVEPSAAYRQFGSAKGLFTMSDDFDAPLEDFEDYM